MNEGGYLASYFTALPLVKLYVGGILSLLTVVEACSDDIFNMSLLRK